MTRVVLLAAAGAGWEPAALSLLERTPDLVVLKRCVDLDDLLAAAASGQADCAVLAADLLGLDANAVDQLRRHGVRAVAVVQPGPAGDASGARAARAGLTRVVAEDELGRLPDVLMSPEQPVDEREPDVPHPGAAPAARGRVVAVWGPAGAPGRTTVAAAVAAELARRRSPTVLIDADPYGGAVAPLLGVLDEVSGLLAAGRLSAAGELPERLVTALRGYGPLLDVLTGLPRAERWAELRPGLVGEIAECGRGSGHVVIDTGFSLEEDGADAHGRPARNQLTLDSLDAADELIVVGAPDPVGLARLARGLVDVRERTSVSPYVVINRMRPSLGWSEREVAGMLAGVVRTEGVWFLPEDRTTVDKASVAGCTLVETAPDAALPKAVARLVDELAPPAPAVGRRGRRADQAENRVRRRKAARARRR